MVPLRIAVCEDNADEQKALLAIVKQSEIPKETTIFSNGEDFLKIYQQGKYDLLLMDIYMGSMTGVEVVTEIYKTDEVLIVSFITTSTSHTLKSYRLKALLYSEKPVKKKAILELLQFAQLKKVNAPRLLLKKDGKDRSVPFERILYAEQKDHTLRLYLTEGNALQENGKLDAIQPQFAQPSFFRCHKSYLVNLSYVAALDKEMMMFVMKEGGGIYPP